MKVPAWVYIVGISMLAFGGCGAINNFSSAFVDSTAMVEQIQEAQNQSMEEMDDEAKEMMESLGLSGDLMNKESMEIAAKYAKYGIPVSILFVITGILFLLKNKITLKLFYFTIAVSIVLSIMSYLELSSSGSSLMGLGAIFGTSLSVLVDVTLLIIVIAADKTQWKYLTGELQAPEDPPHVYES